MDKGSTVYGLFGDFPALQPLMFNLHSWYRLLLLLLPSDTGDILQTVATLSDRLQVDALKQDQL